MLNHSREEVFDRIVRSLDEELAKQAEEIGFGSTDATMQSHVRKLVNLAAFWEGATRPLSDEDKKKTSEAYKALKAAWEKA